MAPLQPVNPAASVDTSNRYDDQAPNTALSAATVSPYVTEQQHQLQQQLHQHLQQHQPQQASAPLNERRYFEPLKGRSTSPVPLAVASTGDPASHYHVSRIPILQSTLLDQHQQRITIDRPQLRSSRLPSAIPSDTASLRSATTQQRRPTSPINHASPVGRSSAAVDSHRHSVAPVSDKNVAPVPAVAAAAANAPPSDELRGQLPWSYFKSRSDTTGPKRTFTQLRDDEDLPPVPVPDYTLHFPRRDRPSTNSSDDGGEFGIVFVTCKATTSNHDIFCSLGRPGAAILMTTPDEMS